MITDFADQFGQPVQARVIKTANGIDAVAVVAPDGGDRARQSTTITSSTAETTIVTAVSAEYHDVYGIIAENTSATPTEITVRDDTGSSTNPIYIYIPAGQTVGFTVPADSAVKQTAVNKNWTAQSSASVASVKITALYVKRT